MIEQFFRILQPLILIVLITLGLILIKKKRANFISFDMKMVGLISVFAAWELLEFVAGMYPEVHVMMAALNSWFYLVISAVILVLIAQRALEVGVFK